MPGHDTSNKEMPLVPLCLSIAFLGLVIYLLATAIVQYGHYATLTPESDNPVFPTLSVLIPARNEEQNIGACLMALTAQEYPTEKLEIIIIDDNSTDRTADIVRNAISTATHRVRLVSGAPLPAGWMGKSFACWQGAAAATGDFLCFMDADTKALPGLLRAAVATAVERQSALLSLEPFQVLGTFWERVIFPAGFFLMAQVHPLERINSPAFPDAVANGQFLLFRKDVYAACGGHSAVRRDTAEDGALARLVKQRGGRLLVLGAEGFIQTRMYTSLGQLWAGIGKVFVEMVKGIRNALVAAVIAVSLAAAAIALPWLDALRAVHHPGFFNVAALCGAALASATLLGTHMGIARHLKIPIVYGLLFPLGYVFGAALAVHSVWLRLAGRGMAWKGRPTAFRET